MATAGTLSIATGDIAVIGSKVIATGDTTLSAARNLTIESGLNSLANDNHSDNKAIGKVVISDTERFAGYNNVKHNDTNAELTQIESNVGSLTGNVALAAGENYTQTASNVLADKNITITAKAIDIGAGASSGTQTQDNSDLKIGAFARISSPLIDMANNIEAAKDAAGRVKTMQNMAAAANAYQAAGEIASGGVLIKAEVGIGFSSASSQDKSSNSQAIGSTVKGGGDVSLTSTEGDIKASGSNIAAGKTLALDSARDILLSAAQSTADSSGSNKSAGAEVGVGYSVGAETGAYAYVTANAGHGDYNNTGTSNANTHLTGETVSLASAGDTTLKGADVKAGTVIADVKGKLAIESVQDSATEHNVQSDVGVRVQVSFGSAWEVSGNASQSKANGSSSAVAEESGLFAGDGGYHVTADSIALKGGAIASTSAANSELSAKAVTFENLDNKMDYKATSLSASGGFSVGGHTTHSSDGQKIEPPKDENGNTIPVNGPSTVGEQVQTLGDRPNSPHKEIGVPMLEKGSDSSTTYATLTDGKINIGGKAMDSAASLGAHTDASSATTAIAPLKDLQSVVAEQKAMSAATSTVVATAGPLAAKYVGDIGQEKQKAAEAEANRYSALAETALRNGDSTQADAYTVQAKEALTTAKNWSDNGVYRVELHVAAQGLIGGIVGGGAGAANAASGVVGGNLGQQLGKTMGEAAADKHSKR